MLSSILGTSFRRMFLNVGRAVGATGLSPNALTLIGVLLNALVGYVLWSGSFLIGGILTLFAGFFDMLDGSVARAHGKISIFGGFFDSTMDRYSESLILLGLLLYFAEANNTTAVVLVYVSAIGSLMVSYARSRAETAGINNEVGLLARTERVIILGVLLVLGFPVVALWILAVGTNITAIQRIWHVYRVTHSNR